MPSRSRDANLAMDHGRPVKFDLDVGVTWRGLKKRQTECVSCQTPSLEVDFVLYVQSIQPPRKITLDLRSASSTWHPASLQTCNCSGTFAQSALPYSITLSLEVRRPPLNPAQVLLCAPAELRGSTHVRDHP